MHVAWSWEGAQRHVKGKAAARGAPWTLARGTGRLSGHGGLRHRLLSGGWGGGRAGGARSASLAQLAQPHGSCWCPKPRARERTWACSSRAQVAGLGRRQIVSVAAGKHHMVVATSAGELFTWCVWRPPMHAMSLMAVLYARQPTEVPHPCVCMVQLGVACSTAKPLVVPQMHACVHAPVFSCHASLHAPAHDACWPPPAPLCRCCG